MTEKSIEEQVAAIKRIAPKGEVAFFLNFGKHKGESICNVPTDYLIYVKHSARSEYLRNKVEEELERRK